MNNIEKLKQLRSYKELHDKLLYLNNRILSISTSSFDNYTSVVGELIDEKANIISQMKSIEDNINSLDNTYERLVLGYRYVQFYSLARIAEELGYSTRQISRICRNAIENLQ